MLNIRRVEEMICLTRLASGKGGKDLRGARYRRGDYIALALVRRFFIGTFAFLLLCAFLAIIMLDSVENMIYSIDYRSFGGELIIAYILFMCIYLGVTCFTAAHRYKRASEKLKEYQSGLRKIEKTYENEDRAAKSR